MFYSNNLLLVLINPKDMYIKDLVKYLLEQHPHLRYIQPESKQESYAMFILYGILCYFKQTRPGHSSAMMYLPTGVSPSYHLMSRLQEKYSAHSAQDRSPIFCNDDESAQFVYSIKALVQRTPVTILMKMLTQYHARPFDRFVYNALKNKVYRRSADRASHIIRVFSNPLEKTLRDHIHGFWTDCVGGESRVSDIIGDYAEFRLTEVAKEELKGHTTKIHTILELPDERLVTVAENDKTIRLWNISTNDHTTLTLKNAPIEVKVMFNGNLVILDDTYDKIVVYDIGTNTCREFDVHDGLLEYIAVSPSQSLIAYTTTSGFYVLDPNVEEKQNGVVAQEEDGYGIFGKVVFLSDGHLACVCRGCVHIYDIELSRLRTLISTEFSKNREISTLVELSEGSLASVSGVRDRYVIQIWNIETGECKQTIEHKSECSSMLYLFEKPQVLQLPDGRLVTIVNGMVRIWDLSYGIYYTPSTSFRICREGQRAILVPINISATPDSHLVTSTLNNDNQYELPDNTLVRVWNPDSGECVNQIGTYTDQKFSTCLMVSSKRQILATGSADGTIRIFKW